jgi:hypothetical protein
MTQHLKDLVDDPSVPDWGKDFIHCVSHKDIVDVLNVLEAIVAAKQAEFDALLAQ